MLTIDPGSTIEKGCRRYDTGVAMNYYFEDSRFTGFVCAGRSHFPGFVKSIGDAGGATSETYR